MDNQPEIKSRMENKEDKKIKEIVKEKITSYILAAFGLVAGLAWNEAIKSFIEYIFPSTGNTLIAKFSYAVLLTIALVIISVYLAKLFKKEEIK